MAPSRPRREPTEISISPVRMTKVMPQATMTAGADWMRRSRKFWRVAKLGLMRETVRRMAKRSVATRMWRRVLGARLAIGVFKE